MATMVAVDLGAQSGRVVVGRFDGERLSVGEVHRFENVPVSTRDVLQWDIHRLFGDVVAGLQAAGRETPVDSVGVDSWAVDFGLLDRDGQLLGNPVHYRDRRRAAAFDGVIATVPGRELYERTGIQLSPINTLNELAAMAAEGDPALEAAETLLLVPDLVHYWLGGRAVAERTNATTTQCLDAHDGTWTADLLDRLGIPSGTPAGGRAARDTARPGQRRDRPGRGAGGRPGDARHRLGGRRRSLPGAALRLRQRRHVVARRPGARRAADRRPDLRREPDQRRRRRRDDPPAPQRHRPLAPARVPPGLGAGGPRLRVRRARHARGRGPSPALARRPGRPPLRDPGRHAAADPRVLRRHRAGRAGRARGRTRCVLESLALGHAQAVRLLEDATGDGPRRGARRRRRRAERAPLPVDGERDGSARPRRPGRGRRCRQPRRPGDGARRARLARARRASWCAPRSCPPSTSPQARREWAEARERFYDLSGESEREEVQA